jgi:hypothetical protein
VSKKIIGALWVCAALLLAVALVAGCGPAGPEGPAGEAAVAYDVPDQSGSLPGLLSAADPVEGREIGEVPAYVTGPASRACGGCHRAELINEDAAGELAILNQHTKQGGYLVEGGEDASSTLATIIAEIMAIFK